LRAAFLRIGEGAFGAVFHAAAALSFLSAPRATIFKASSGSCRWSAFTKTRASIVAFRATVPCLWVHHRHRHGALTGV